ncbi:hypothetical protein KRMM14A1004_59640 [Krasilnikovia sp. MM14-A1004]
MQAKTAYAPVIEGLVGHTAFVPERALTEQLPLGVEALQTMSRSNKEGQDLVSRLFVRSTVVAKYQ